MWTMRRTKIEVFIDVLATMNERKPLKITHLTQKVNLNASLAREWLDFMVKQGLIEKQLVSKKREAYKITERGKTVLGYFNMVKQATPQEVWCKQTVRQRK
jgi:predicted transcriptional regulator